MLTNARQKAKARGFYTGAVHLLVLAAVGCGQAQQQPSENEWTEPRQLGPVATCNIEAGPRPMNPLIAVLPDGGGLAAWPSAGVSVARFQASGGWGAVEKATALGPAFCVTPGVGGDASGRAVLGWLDTSLSASAVQSETPGAWSAPTVLGPDAHEVRVAVDPGGAALAVWDGGSDLHASRFEPGSGWGPAEDIPLAGYGDSASPRIVADGSGGFIVTSLAVGGSPWSLWSVRFTNNAWQPPLRLAQAAGVYSNSLAGDGAGGAIVAWSDSAGIHARRFSSSLGWGADETAAAGRSGWGPEPAGAANRAVVAWFQTETQPERNELMVAVLVDGAWSAPVRLAVLEYGRGGGLRVASDPSGNALVVWHDRTQFWASRRAASAPAWSEPRSFHAADDPGGLDLGVDRAGRVTAVWSQGRYANAAVWTSRTLLP